MELDLNNFNIRKTKPIILGNAGLPDNVERYTAKAEGILGIDVFEGDEIKILNIEGSQELELSFFNDQGLNTSLIDKDFIKDAKFTKFILQNSQDKDLLIKKLKNKKINLDKIKSLIFFNEETEAGAEENILIEKNGFALFAAPGEPMNVDSSVVASDLEIYITRKNKKNLKLESILPEPLADTKNEFLIKNSTAKAYEIKKGDFIQIIDLHGRQCSDFMAFDAEALHKGKEYSIDSTATRSIVNGAYPMPGLYSKYFDKNQDALVEVIQDTIGRHDTFGVACTLKSYEDQGYFGHVNCSDNFNYQLNPFGVEKRNAWAAINLFLILG